MQRHHRILVNLVQAENPADTLVLPGRRRRGGVLFRGKRRGEGGLFKACKSHIAEQVLSRCNDRKHALNGDDVVLSGLATNMQKTTSSLQIR
ncbi:hypothetical protein DPEC_G00266480 [Dallia pectoralis]|uniref:Uncharacterized protein n=1 Tax=Dallia pectoralis TaxID=75939 RepID=A0ACC2FNC2_DALPE|nr:hypothetical protein DPEC_G00266480 [Dallia pectoralis]